MSVYKVRRGNETLDVDGFTALVEMARTGELKPDDAVFVPASNRWHYARSIRQLREHFPQVEDPPPPSGKVRAITNARQELPAPPKSPEPDPTESTHVQDEQGSGGDVVPLRRGRWTPEGKGVEVPVFNYDVDVEPPKVVKPFRFVAVVAFALTIGGSLYLYKTSYARYIAEYREREAAALEAAAREKTPTPIPAPGTPAPVRSIAPGITPPATPEKTAVAVAKTPEVAATPVPLPEFDSAGASSRVMTAKVSPIARPDQFGGAVKSDLARLAVPVRSVKLVPGKVTKKGVPPPWEVVVDYAIDEDHTAAARAKHYWMIAAMAGRRATELKLNLGSTTVRTFRGAAKKPSSQAVLSPETVKGVASGSTRVDAFLRSFPDLLK